MNQIKFWNAWVGYATMGFLLFLGESLGGLSFFHCNNCTGCWYWGVKVGFIDKALQCGCGHQRDDSFCGSRSFRLWCSCYILPSGATSYSFICLNYAKILHNIVPIKILSHEKTFFAIMLLWNLINAVIFFIYWQLQLKLSILEVQDWRVYSAV